MCEIGVLIISDYLYSICSSFLFLLLWCFVVYNKLWNRSFILLASLIVPWTTVKKTWCVLTHKTPWNLTKTRVSRKTQTFQKFNFSLKQNSWCYSNHSSWARILQSLDVLKSTFKPKNKHSQRIVHVVCTNQTHKQNNQTNNPILWHCLLWINFLSLSWYYFAMDFFNHDNKKDCHLQIMFMFMCVCVRLCVKM